MRMHQCWFIVDKHERWHRAEPVYWDEHKAGHLRTLLPSLDRTYPDRAPHRVVHLVPVDLARHILDSLVTAVPRSEWDEEMVDDYCKCLGVEVVGK